MVFPCPFPSFLTMKKAKHLSKSGRSNDKMSKERSTNDHIWGINTVNEFLRKKPQEILEVWISDSKKSSKFKEIIELAEQHMIRVHLESPPQLLQNIIPAKHQGIIAAIKPLTTLPFETLTEKTKKMANPILLVLDSIQDQHNLGAIIRSASATGVAGIILPKDRAAPLTATTAKVSAGALASIDISIVTNLTNALIKLKQAGYWIYGADIAGTQTIYQSNFSGPVCLVIGGEHKGIRPLIKKQCDFLVTIPMQNNLDSLNASVATAVILFEIIRQQQYNK